MTSFNEAPIQDPVIGDDKKAKKTWIFFFNQLSSGDSGTAWTPVFSNLAGSFNISGRYFRNSGFIDVWVQIDPITNSTSTLGTTYIELPFDATISSPCNAIYGTTILQGLIDPSTNRMLPPSWAAVGTVVTLTARIYTK